ncbi:MAG: GntR family transcriptional regulator [Eggerthellaceae bacterium]|nr:GntR family transcriptional regulator [Eggerthellaceae bacterium]
MLIRIDQSSDEPLYLQIRSQVIAAIAREEIAPGFALPSVRSLAGDLGINLHTVNKAYAVLRDEGYVVMRGRAGAVVADPSRHVSASQSEAATQNLQDSLYSLALAHRARAQSAASFMDCAREAVEKAFKEEDR